MDKLEQIQKLWGEEYKIKITTSDEVLIYDKNYLEKEIKYNIKEKELRVGFYYSTTIQISELKKIQETYKIMGW